MHFHYTNKSFIWKPWKLKKLLDCKVWYKVFKDNMLIKLNNLLSHVIIIRFVLKKNYIFEQVYIYNGRNKKSPAWSKLAARSLPYTALLEKNSIGKWILKSGFSISLRHYLQSHKRVKWKFKGVQTAFNSG